MKKDAKLCCKHYAFFPRRLMYRSIESLNIPLFPPGIPRAFDVFSCPGGREFD